MLGRAKRVRVEKERNRREAACAGKLDVQKHDVGREAAHHGDGIGRRSRRADHLEIIFVAQNACQAFAHNRVVVYEKNADHTPSVLRSGAVFSSVP